MRKLYFLIIYIILVLFHVKQSYAFSLGSIDVKNKFGEKFSAKIPVNNDGKFGLKAYIGTNTDYEMMGVQRPDILNDLSVKVIEDQDAKSIPFIIISSKKILFYPSFELIVKALLDGGAILEKYIIAVDFKRNLSLSMSDEPAEKQEVDLASNLDENTIEPPTHEKIKMDSVSTKKIVADASINPIAENKPLTKRKKNTKSKFPISLKNDEKKIKPLLHVKVKKGFDKYGPVKFGETLYLIANKLKIKGYATGQVVVALWEMNKRSFKNRNMNRLMAGTYLDYSKIKARLKELSLNSSIKMIDSQRILWRNKSMTSLNNNTKKLKLLPAISDNMDYINILNDRVDKWRNAWETGEIEELGNFYSEKFNSINKNKADWMKYKEGFNSRHNQIKIEYGNIEFLKLDQSSIYVSFLQRFNSTEMKSIGVKTLKFIKDGQEWYIENELWDGMIKSSSKSPYVIHVASVASLEDAVFETNRLRKLGYKSYFAFFKIPGKGLWYRVFVNRFRYKISALKLASNMLKKNHLKYALPMKLSYSVTFGFFDNEDGAKDVIKQINKEDINFAPFLYISNKSTGVGAEGFRYNVLAGAFYANDQAKLLEAKLTQKKIDYKLIIP